ncbi:uncharacterized protein K02A2.6-like [Haliotis rufescens]|uniref:uncharacterized protein K02A2.6-like n=1 Tax=Haliotis rufescens TaxID=6454 RepID=UPI00201F2F66|nr:uncharacterized protein K02A2.6-like [Haliotis rufescens]
MLRLQKYDFTVVYKKGSLMFMADTLSPAYLPHDRQLITDEGQVLMIDMRSPTAIDIETIQMVEHLSISQQRLAELKQATSKDTCMSKLMQLIRQGLPPSKEDVPHSVREYFTFRDELAMQNGVVFKGERVVVPAGIRGNIMERIHSSHIGVQGCIRRAKELVYWPNMGQEIIDLVSKCETCNTLQQDQSMEPLISHHIPTRPWEKLGCDLFEFDQKDFLITVDYNSDFFEVDRLHSKKAPEINKKLKSHLARHGIPNQIISDNSPPFNSEAFRKFSDNYEFEHVTSSPRYPHSNGKVESAVKIAKKLMTKSLHAQTDPYLALLDWRNVPTEGIGFSPVQRLFSRRTKTKLPTASTLLQPKTVNGVSDKIACKKTKQAYYFNRGTNELPALKEGDVVRVKPTKFDKQWKKAVIEQQVDVRSYELRTEDGSNLRRNRRHLRKSHEAPPLFVDTDMAERNQLEPDLCVERTSAETPMRNCTDKPVDQTSSKTTERVQIPAQTTRQSSETTKKRTSRGRVIKQPSRFRGYLTNYEL